MTKARKLADLIDPRNEEQPHWRDLESAAEELRRLSDENQMIRLEKAELFARKYEIEEAFNLVLEYFGEIEK